MGFSGAFSTTYYLTLKDVSWWWTEVEEAKFDPIKKLVTTAPCLALVDLADKTVELIVNTNALLVTVGGMVLATIAGRQKPVTCYS